MRARELMTNDVEACEPRDTLRRAAEIMWNRDCGCVPVVDDTNRVVGIITDRDICMASYTRGLPIEAIRVGSVMAGEVRTCGPNDTMETISEAMRERRVRRLPVVDANNRLMGIVSLNDMTLSVQNFTPLGPKKLLDKQRIVETLATICERRVAAHA